jgi:hypothetical protein
MAGGSAGHLSYEALPIFLPISCLRAKVIFSRDSQRSNGSTPSSMA